MTPQTSGPTTPTRTTPATVVERRFPATPDAAGAARRALERLVASDLDEDGLDNARLLTSELVTNAVRHGPKGRHEVTLHVHVRADAVRVEVIDDGDGFRPPPRSARQTGGWGLVVVDGVASRWGIEDGHPTTVWFEIDRPPETADRLRGSPAWPESFDPLLLDAENAAVIAADVDGTVTRWNRHAARLFGREAIEVIGRPVTEVLVLGGDTAAADAMMRRLRRGGAWDGEWLVPRRDGARIWVRLATAPVHDDDGSLIGMVAVCVDIDDRKRTQNALTESEERLRIALDAGRMGTWDWDVRDDTMSWSESLERMHGLETGAFAGTFEASLAHVHLEDGARVRESIERVLRDGTDYGLDYRIVRPTDGAVRWLVARGRVLRDDDGRPVRMAGVCADITERKSVERNLSVQYAVARVLTEATTAEEAAAPLLETIARSFGWEVAALWRVDEDDRLLRFVGGWSAEGTPGDRFLARSRELALEPGLGLPGRVWSAGRPVWIPDLEAQDGLPRASLALAEGLHAAFGFPITLGAEVLGVVEFASRRIREPDEELLELVGATGAQIGQFLERRATENELVESEARTTAILESAREAIVSMDEHGTIVEMNPAAAEMFGRDRDESIGRELAELFIPPTLRDRHREALARYRRLGRGRILGRRLELAGMRADGSEFPVELTVTRVHLPDPDEILFTGYIRDITPRRRAEELQARLLESERTAREQVERAHARSAFLAEASVILGSSLDHRRTLAKIARLSVPRLADWCSVDLLESDGSVQSVAVAHADPDKVELVREYRRRFPVEGTPGGGVVEVVERGEPIVYPDVTPAVLEQRMPDPQRRAMLAELGIRSVMVVPLVARDQPIGSISFVSATPARRFGRDDLELAQELARRAALALDNARLYEERSRIARTLQRTLLPRRLPEIAGVGVEAFYQPAGVMQTEVGGDFYDVFEAGDDAWGVVVGDVCGKGIDAAALTGMARHTLRASAVRSLSPRGALEDLNRVMLREDGERFCTVALGRLEPGPRGVRLTVACGGHPSPLVVRRTGVVETVGSPGTLLGVFDDVWIEDRAVELGGGDQVVFYTDGLVDARHPNAIDEAALRRLAASCAGGPAGRTVERLGDAAADPGGEAPDDVCVLVIGVDG